MKKKVVPLNKQLGASLLEAIAFIAISAIVIYGAVALIKSSFSGTNTNEAVSELSTIRTGAKSLFSGSGGYGSGNLNSVLINAQVFPSTMAVSGSTVTNPWNGSVVVTGASQQFTINYPNVPQDVCVKTVTGSGSGWDGLTVNGAAVALPANPNTANTACSASSNTLLYTAS